MYLLINKAQGRRYSSGKLVDFYKINSKSVTVRSGTQARMEATGNVLLLVVTTPSRREEGKWLKVAGQVSEIEYGRSST